MASASPASSPSSSPASAPASASAGSPASSPSASLARSPAGRLRAWLTPRRALELFCLSNLAFLGLDIALAHAANSFARKEEWAPVYVSAIASLVYLPGRVSERVRDKTWALDVTIGVVSIVTGVAGMLLHLESAFFASQTLRELVYSAPFVAPLSYVGVGLLVLLGRLEPEGTVDWAKWVLLLSLGGMVGNFGLSLLDHAQNGFFARTEWIGVVAGAFGTGFLALAVARPLDDVLRRGCWLVLLLEALVGLLGFGLHLAGNAHRNGPWLDRILYGAPSFAPLLFTNIALLAAIGLWALEGAGERRIASAESIALPRAAEPEPAMISKRPSLPRPALSTLALALCLAALAAASCKKDEPAPSGGTGQAQQPARKPGEIDENALKAFAPLPDVMASPDNPLTEDKITLGRALYYETRLSASNEISCNTCHLLSTSGAEGRKSSIGHKKQEGKRNAPTVYNAAGHIAQFWDGRAPNVEEQAKGPILNPIEMGMESSGHVIAELKRVPWYVEQFKKAFPGQNDPMTYDNLGRAIGAFERKLVTPSRWDKFLKGDKAALTAAEKDGFQKFVDTGCPTCHNGAYVGGGMFQKLGLVTPWPKTDDPGRFEVTKNEADKMVFKVPSLRNIEKTAPYFHDGSVATLPEAIKLMAKHQLGKDLSPADVASIETFLKALTGDIPRDYVAEYKVPAEIPSAPKPGKPAPAPAK